MQKHRRPLSYATQNLKFAKSWGFSFNICIEEQKTWKVMKEWEKISDVEMQPRLKKEFLASFEI